MAKSMLISFLDLSLRYLSSDLMSCYITPCVTQGGHGTGKTGNLVLTFSRQGKHREFCSDTGKKLLTRGKYLDCDY